MRQRRLTIADGTLPVTRLVAAAGDARATALVRSSAARLIGAEAASRAHVLRVDDSSTAAALARADLPRNVLAVSADALVAIAAVDGPVLVASCASEPSASDRRQLDAHEGVLPAGSTAATLTATCALHDVPLLVPWARVRRKRARDEEHAGGDIDLAAYEAADEADAAGAENEYASSSSSDDDFDAPAEPLAQLELGNIAGAAAAAAEEEEEPARDARGRVPRLEAMDALERANPVPAFDGHVVLHAAEHKYAVDGVLGVYRSTTEQVHRFFAEFNGDEAALTCLTGGNWLRKPEHASVMATVLSAWADGGLLAASPHAEAAAHAFIRGQLPYEALLSSEHAAVRALVPPYLAVGTEALCLAWAENGRNASAAGTDMHECIEFFFRGVYTLEDMEALAASTHPELRQFLDFYHAEIEGKYAPYRMELLVADPELRTCGAIDGLFINLRTGALRMFDWKRTKELKYRAYKGACGTGPFAAVPDTNYWHYVIQQNIYRYYLRRYAGLELEDGMALAIFHPLHERYELVPMPRERSSSSSTTTAASGSDEVLDLVVPRYINPVVPPSFLLSAPVVRGVNMVVTCSLNASIDPTHCARNYPGLFVNPRRFAAGTSRTANAVALFFSSGRVVCTGASSLQLARSECKRLALRWLAMGQLVSFSNFGVENIVCSACAGHYLDLNAIARACPVDAQYDAALFPGLIFRFRSPSIVCLLFLKGPCIITGSKSMAETLACWAWLYNAVLCRFRLYNVSALSSAEYHARSTLAADTSVRDMERLYREHVQRQTRAACRDTHVDVDACADALVDAYARAPPGLSALEAMYEAVAATVEAPAEALSVGASVEALTLSASAEALTLSASAEAERWHLADTERRLAQRRGPLDARLARLFAEAVDAGGRCGSE